MMGAAGCRHGSREFAEGPRPGAFKSSTGVRNEVNVHVIDANIDLIVTCPIIAFVKVEFKRDFGRVRGDFKGLGNFRTVRTQPQA
jgi:hypothetical protein